MFYCDNSEQDPTEIITEKKQGLLSRIERWEKKPREGKFTKAGAWR